jgi:hypothetical protein
LAALENLAQNKKINALCLEQHEKGSVHDYEAIRSTVLQEDKVLPTDQIGERKYGSTTAHTSSPISAACYTPPIQLKKNWEHQFIAERS